MTKMNWVAAIKSKQTQQVGAAHTLRSAHRHSNHILSRVTRDAMTTTRPWADLRLLFDDELQGCSPGRARFAGTGLQARCTVLRKAVELRDRVTFEPSCQEVNGPQLDRLAAGGVAGPGRVAELDNIGQDVARRGVRCYELLLPLVDLHSEFVLPV